MKYLSILSLMTAFAAFSSDASADPCQCLDNNKNNACNTLLKELLGEGKLPAECGGQVANKDACLKNLTHDSVPEKNEKIKNAGEACTTCADFKCKQTQGMLENRE